MPLPRRTRAENSAILIYNIYTLWAIAPTIGSQGALHKANHDLGKDALFNQTLLANPTVSPSSISVQVPQSDLLISSALVLTFVSLINVVYTLLLNGLNLAPYRHKYRWIDRFVSWVESARTHRKLGVYAAGLWVMEVASILFAMYIALRLRRVHVTVDGNKLSSSTVQSLEHAANMQTKYWGISYVRLMVYFTWIHIIIAPAAFYIHYLAYRRLSVQEGGGRNESQLELQADAGRGYGAGAGAGQYGVGGNVGGRGPSTSMSDDHHHHHHGRVQRPDDAHVHVHGTYPPPPTYAAGRGAR